MTIPGTLSAFASSSVHDPQPAKGTSAPLIIGLLAGGLLVMVMCGGVLLALLLPAVQVANEGARRIQCINNAKNIGLAFHNHHDVHKRLPLASSEPVSGIPGNGTNPNPAGYSWTVSLLPYLEESILYDVLSDQSQKFQVQPFDNALTQAPAGDQGSTELAVLRCPSSGAPYHVDVNASDYQEYPRGGEMQSPAISSYMVMPASHLVNQRGPAELYDPNTEDETYGNGMIVFPLDPVQAIHKGLGFREALDGTSKTILFCETREEAYAAWIDGQTAWGVGAWPENLDIPAAVNSTDGYLGWPDSDVSSLTSLEAADTASYDHSIMYMEKSRLGTTYNRRFGPSSGHADGVVNHAFTDGHVVSIITDAIDCNVYLRMISRAGGEPVIVDDF